MNLQKTASESVSWQLL